MKTIALAGGGSAGHVVPHLSMPSTRHGAKSILCVTIFPYYQTFSSMPSTRHGAKVVFASFYLSMPSTRHGAKVVFASFYLTSNVLQVIISKKSYTNYT